jgi:hypothetical protein
MSRRRCSEGGRRLPRRPYLAMVEGEDAGVPWRIFFKRMDCAERMAKKFPEAKLTDLTTLITRRWHRAMCAWAVCN